MHSPNPNLGLEYVTLDELYARADVISIHCPLMPATRHMIDKDAIAKMKDGVIFINVARGGLVDSKLWLTQLKLANSVA